MVHSLRSRFLPNASAGKCLLMLQYYLWRRGRVVEGTPLLREHTGQNLYPGFESLRLRQFLDVQVVGDICLRASQRFRP